VTHYYLDSSALIKQYIAETGTTWINNLHRGQADHVLYLVRISAAEFIAALFRRVRTGDIREADARTVATQFKIDFRIRYQVVEITEQLIDSAMTLAEKHGLRGYDTVQLAAAVELQAVRISLSLPGITFVCADDQLNAAAVAEGFLVENPNHY
jgi:predicted nucleic acid-binding protein